MRVLIAISGCLVCASVASAQTTQNKTPTETKSEQPTAGAKAALTLDDIVAPGEKPVAIVTGMKFTEGPLWVRSRSPFAPGHLLFSDIPADTVYEWRPPEGSNPEKLILGVSKAEKVIQPSGNSNGLALVGDRLLLAQHAGRVSSGEVAGGEPKLLVERFEGKSLNSPNDLVVKSDGSIYFTDPPYGLGARTKGLDFCGVFRLAKDGTLTLLNKALPTPNGLAFSPDESILYVADTSLGEIRAFGVKPEGTLDDGRIFAALRAKNDKGEERPAGGDGVKVDVRGNVYCAARGGVWVFTPAGEKLGVIETTPSPTNLCFGGPDNRTMFITTRSGVHAVNVKISGR